MILSILKDLLFPRKCVLCGKLLSSGELDLCVKCRMETGDAEQDRKLPGFASVTVLWDYEDGVRESLLRYKFHGKAAYGKSYGRLLAMRLLRRRIRPDLITWVPVSRERLRQRGYDQSELVARAIGQELGIPVERTLCKVRDNPAQSGISDAVSRRENVKLAYEAVSSGVRGKRVLLVDDILTTGATASECARTLAEAGAGEVLLAVIAAGSKKRYTDSSGTECGTET